MDETHIKAILENLSEGINKGADTAYKELGVEFEGLESPEDFSFLTLHPIEKVLKGAIRKISTDPDFSFIYLNYWFVKRGFETIIEKIEGAQCCADKSRTITKRLAIFFKTGKEIVFNYDGEYTFHLPEKVFTTHKEIISFYTSLKYLKSGSYEPFLESLRHIASKIEEV